MRSRSLILVFVAAISWALEGQSGLPTILIVDSSNGPGTNFTDLPPAIAAAANGDTVIVRAGTYSSFVSTGKALTIRGAGAPSTTIGPAAPSPNPANEIAAVPAGMTFFVDGVKFSPVVAGGGFPPPPVPAAALRVVGPGTVVLADVAILGAAVTLGSSAGLIVSNGAEVHVSRSTINGSSASASGGIGVEVVGASLAVDGSTITGGTGGFGGIFSGGTGMLVSGVATLSRSSVYGGPGPYGGSYGVYAAGGIVRVVGTSADVIQGGPAFFGVPFQGLTIFASPSASVVVHGNVTILPSSPGRPLTSGAVTTGAPALPYLSITGTETPAGELLANHPVTVTFDGVIPFAPFALVVDLSPALSTAFAYVLEGELLVPIPTVITLEGSLDAAGMLQFTLPALGAPSLTELPIYLQFGALDVVAGKVRMSNGLIRVFTN